MRIHPQWTKENITTNRGFTTIELLVTLLIIAVLLALVLPAVQSARQTARTTECRNKLRNLITACHAMQSAGQRFPAAFKVFEPGGYGFSMHTQLLPYIEQNAVLEAFDLKQDPRVKTNRQVVVDSRPNVFVCPEISPVDAATSYLGNSGSGSPPNESSDFTNLRDGFLQPPPGSQPENFKDGLSNTVAIAECAQMTSSLDPSGQFLLLRANVSDRESWKQYRDDCWRRYQLGVFDNVTLQGWFQGEYWASPQLPDSRYTHVFPPNTANCFDSAGGSTAHAISTAGSNHDGFLNAALADGSVRSFSFQIDPAVWAGIGTRNDGTSRLE